jgi:hypothetical protein
VSGVYSKRTLTAYLTEVLQHTAQEYWNHQWQSNKPEKGRLMDSKTIKYSPVTQQIFKRRMTKYFVEENTILARGGQIVHLRLA